MRCMYKCKKKLKNCIDSIKTNIEFLRRYLLVLRVLLGRINAKKHFGLEQHWCKQPLTPPVALEALMWLVATCDNIVLRRYWYFGRSSASSYLSSYYEGHKCDFATKRKVSLTLDCPAIVCIMRFNVCLCVVAILIPIRCS